MEPKRKDVFSDLPHGADYTETEKKLVENLEILREEEKKLLVGINQLGNQNSLFSNFSQEDNFLVIKKKVELKRKRKRILNLTSVAASLFLILGTITLYLKTDTSHEGIGAIDTHAITGKQEAQLFLPNGQIISLDNENGQILLSDGETCLIKEKHTLIYSNDSEENVSAHYHTIKVPRGAEYNLLLSDGTKIYLNAGTTLKYPSTFNGNTREVFLEGEGFFDVVENTARPFIVHSGELTIKVLGTSFNINAYPEHKQMITTLVEGRIDASYFQQNHQMYPGNQVICDKENGSSEMRVVDVNLYTTWKDGHYRFENMSLDEIMRTFSYWYDLEIIFEEDDMRLIEFTGNLKRYDNINSLLKKMEHTGVLEFIINKNSVTIKRK